MNPGDLFDSPLKLLIIAVLIIVLFGSKKLPVAARSLGRSMRILKSEVQGLHDDDADPEAAPAAQPAVQQIPAAPPVAAPQPVAAPPPVAAQPSLTDQQRIDSLQQQISELKQSSVRETASVPADQPRS